MRSWISSSVAETRAVGRELAAELGPDGILLLSGGLGAGKTVLVQGLAEALGLDPAEVQSPTYTLVREHRVPDAAPGGPGRGAHRARALIHVDLYRLEAGEVERTGIEELLLGPGIKAVEWAERLPFPVDGAVEVSIERDGERRAIRRSR